MIKQKLTAQEASDLAISKLEGQNHSRAVTLQTAFAFDDVNMVESERKHTNKKTGLTSISARVYNLLPLSCKDPSVTTYKTLNPSLNGAMLKDMRTGDMVSAADAVLPDLKALVEARKLGLASFVKNAKNGAITLRFVPIGGTAVTADAALAFIQANPTHPAVVAYIESRMSAEAV
jgi:hypothetical protein